MARSYGFEHFMVGKHPQSRSLRARDKAQLSQTPRVGPPTHGIHYGTQHPQTEELIHAHQMEAQFEELAGLPKPVQETHDAVDKPAPTPRGAPIGAMPGPLERPATAEMKDLLGDGERYWRTMRLAARELVIAGGQLVLLPWQAARLVAQRWVQR